MLKTVGRGCSVAHLTEQQLRSDERLFFGFGNGSACGRGAQLRVHFYPVMKRLAVFHVGKCNRKAAPDAARISPERAKHEKTLTSSPGELIYAPRISTVIS